MRSAPHCLRASATMRLSSPTTSPHDRGRDTETVCHVRFGSLGNMAAVSCRFTPMADIRRLGCDVRLSEERTLRDVQADALLTALLKHDGGSSTC